MSNIAVEFNNVGKLYHLGTVGTGTLSHDLNRWWKVNVLRREDPYLKVGETNDRTQAGQSQFVWALKDITFNVAHGDVVGIIGKNGAGKSTLLKLLSRVTSPTTGTIRAKGRIASLLEVGTGFHPEMTGRENIYMNGTIMGMKRSEITSKLDEIVDFAGVARYLDTPVKRYSSGMMVRLGFAVAAFLEPEILVVDEVLAVGDAEFQKKAIGKMQDVTAEEGRTVLFVSHNMAAVRSLCKSGIVLENGQVKFSGSASDAITQYLADDAYHNITDRIVDRVNFTKGGMKIHEIRINGTNLCKSTVVSGQKTMDIEISGTTDNDLTTDILMTWVTKDEVPMATLAEGHYKGNLLKFHAGPFTIKKTIMLPEYISHGTYYINLSMHHPMVEWQLGAPHCMEIEVQGNQLGTGLALNQFDSGFFGFETIKNP